MQNRSKPFKNSLFEDIEYEEIAEKGKKFADSWPDNSLPARTMEWEIPRLSETVKKEAKKFRIYPAAVWAGQAIGHGSVLILSLVLQLVWFFVLVFWAALSGLFMSFEDVLSGRFGHGQRHGLEDWIRQGQRQGRESWSDWRDMPTGCEGGQTHVRRQENRTRQGHVNNVNVNVNVNIENH